MIRSFYSSRVCRALLVVGIFGGACRPRVDEGQRLAGVDSEGSVAPAKDSYLELPWVRAGMEMTRSDLSTAQRQAIAQAHVIGAQRFVKILAAASLTSTPEEQELKRAILKGAGFPHEKALLLLNSGVLDFGGTICDTGCVTKNVFQSATLSEDGDWLTERRARFDLRGMGTTSVYRYKRVGDRWVFRPGQR